MAWNAIARESIMRDPGWQRGHYYGTGRTADGGMGVARMVGHVTYLSAPALADKFGRRLQASDDVRFTISEPEFEVESYLRHQADSFVKRFDANTYLYTSRALTYFDLAPTVRRRARSHARWNRLPRVRCLSRSAPTGSTHRRRRKEIHDALFALGKEVEFHVIEAPYGHDCFLLEEARQTPIIRRFLADGERLRS